MSIERQGVYITPELGSTVNKRCNKTHLLSLGDSLVHHLRSNRKFYLAKVEEGEEDDSFLVQLTFREGRDGSRMMINDDLGVTYPLSYYCEIIGAEDEVLIAPRHNWYVVLKYRGWLIQPDCKITFIEK